MGFSLFGSSGSSSSASTVNTTTTETTNSNLQGIEGAAFSNISGSEITLSDKRAIEQAFAATAEALEFAAKASENALDFAFKAGAPDAAISKDQLYVGGGVLGFGLLAWAWVNSRKKK